MNATLSAGFADPVTDAQHCFRAVLEAMSRPGTVCRAGAEQPPPGLSPAAAAVLLSLVDHETPLWLDPGAEAAWNWVAFHCGAPRTVDVSGAQFALALTLPDLSGLNAGSHEMPETSTTVIVEVASLSAGQRYRLSGPGLRVPKIIAVDGLPNDFLESWQRNHALYPCGVDLILCVGDSLTALPRSVAIEEA
jgi:alpha-D-ribose 1-methylphosphonate 5-triphosphate synthase subunit PhnH